jgi:hypothetical protein
MLRKASEEILRAGSHGSQLLPLGCDRRPSVYGELGEIQSGASIQIALLVQVVQGVTRAGAHEVEVFVMRGVVAHPFRLVKRKIP